MRWLPVWTHLMTISIVVFEEGFIRLEILDKLTNLNVL